MKTAKEMAALTEEARDRNIEEFLKSIQPQMEEAVRRGESQIIVQCEYTYWIVDRLKKLGYHTWSDQREPGLFISW